MPDDGETRVMYVVMPEVDDDDVDDDQPDSRYCEKDDPECTHEVIEEWDSATEVWAIVDMWPVGVEVIFTDHRAIKL